MSLIESILNNDEFNTRNVTILRSKVDSTLLMFADNEYLNQFMEYLCRARRNELCAEDEDNAVAGYALDFLICNIIINAYDRKQKDEEFRLP